MAATVDTEFESTFVHRVYDQIAQDFSRTRHSGWKFIEHFLEQLPAVCRLSPALSSPSRVEFARQFMRLFSNRVGKPRIGRRMRQWEISRLQLYYSAAGEQGNGRKLANEQFIGESLLAIDPSSNRK